MGVMYSCNKYEVFSADNRGADNILIVLLSSIAINNEQENNMLNLVKTKCSLKMDIMI